MKRSSTKPQKILIWKACLDAVLIVGIVYALFVLLNSLLESFFGISLSPTSFFLIYPPHWGWLVLFVLLFTKIALNRKKGYIIKNLY